MFNKGLGKTLKFGGTMGSKLGKKLGAKKPKMATPSATPKVKPIPNYTNSTLLNRLNKKLKRGK